MTQTLENIVLLCLKALMKVLKTMQIEDEPPVDDEIHPIVIFAILEVLPTSKASKLYT